MDEDASGPPPSSPTPRETLVSNEQVKYNVIYINGIAIAVFAIGGFAPIIGIATAGGQGLSAAIFLVAGVCWIVSFFLHWIVLRRLRSLTA